MQRLLEFHNEKLYCHHSIDEHPRQEDFPLHSHEMMEILYFLRGNVQYLVEGNIYHLQPRDLMIMRSAETHKLELLDDSVYERIAIHFPSSLLSGLGLDQSLLAPFLDRSLGQMNLYSAQQFPNQIWHTMFSNFDFTNSVQQQAHLLGRILSILPSICDTFSLQQAEQIPIKPEGLAVQLVAYVNAHLFEELSVKQVADAFYLSTSQVGRIFTKSTGISLWGYVKLKRLLSAQAMLERGESAGKVCAVCGYNDYSAFYRAYCAQFGHSPKSSLSCRP